MANVNDKFRSLVEGLYISSTAGGMKWTTFSDNGSYVATVGNNKVEIDSSLNEQGEDLIAINVYDASGQRVDSFTDEYFNRKQEPQHVTATNYFVLMSNLYEVARRSATGADKVIDDILIRLGAPKIDSDDVPF